MNNLKYVLFILLPFCLFSCVDPGCSYGIDICWVEYDIEIGYESDPPVRNIAIGDTFTITMDIPHIVEDTETGELYDISHLDYSKTFSLHKMNLDNKTYKSAPVNSFHYYAIEGEGVIGVTQLDEFIEVVRLSFADLQDRKTISFNVVPQDSGTYFGYISFNDRNLEETENRQVNLTDTCCLERVVLTHDYRLDNNIDLIPDVTGWGQKYDNWTTSIHPQDLDTGDLSRYGLFFFTVSE